jgi:hypothetical protein
VISTFLYVMTLLRIHQLSFQDQDWFDCRHNTFGI